MPLETRKLFLGHRNGDITTHYSAPEPEALLDAANKVCEKNSGNGGTETEVGLHVTRISIQLQVLSGASAAINPGIGPSVSPSHDR